MLKFGFEREFFVMKGDSVVIPSHPIPRDGVLAEARGKPDACPIEAAYSLLAEEHRMRGWLPEGLTFSEVPVLKVSRELRIKSARTAAKGLVHYQNLYGHARHRHKQSEMTAGLHVSVTRSREIFTEKGSMRVNEMFDYAQLVRRMDDVFFKEIKAASRRPGFYEIKGDGRVEYRSLPNDIDIMAVAEFLDSNVKHIHGSW